MFETIDQIAWQALNGGYGPLVGTAHSWRSGLQFATVVLLCGFGAGDAPGAEEGPHPGACNRKITGSRRLRNPIGAA
jgi:hypothetical protein